MLILCILLTPHRCSHSEHSPHGFDGSRLDALGTCLDIVIGGKADEGANEGRNKRPRLDAQESNRTLEGADPWAIAEGDWNDTPSTGEAASWERVAIEAERAFQLRQETSVQMISVESNAAGGLQQCRAHQPPCAGFGHGFGIVGPRRIESETVEGFPAPAAVEDKVNSPLRCSKGQGVHDFRHEVRTSYPAPRNISFGAESSKVAVQRNGQEQRRTLCQHLAKSSVAGAVTGGDVLPPDHRPGMLGPPLESLGLPEPVLNYYHRVKKISHLYPWQAECLSLKGVSEHCSNLVYAAPTSGGKSLVAEVLLLKRLLRGTNSAGGPIGLVILPFVTLCSERADELSKMLKPLKVEVRRCFGGQGGKLPPVGGPGGLIVATPEKANMIITKLIEEDRVCELVAVVVDELHMVQDSKRGATLEIALTKLLFAAGKAGHLAGCTEGWSPGTKGDANGSPLKPIHDHLVPLTLGSELEQLPMQIVGMSATLPNLDGLAKWLNDAELYETDFRPVELSIFVKKGKTVHAISALEAKTSTDAESTPESTVPFQERMLSGESDLDHVVELVRETLDIPDGGGVIVFCTTRKECERVANTLAARLAACGGTESEAKHEKMESVENQRAQADAQMHDTLSYIVDQLQRHQKRDASAADNNKSLASCVSKGFAWHNAGLHPEERTLVEQAFKSGMVRAVCCTTTMAAGVNMPASRVIIFQPYVFRFGSNEHELLPSRDLLQMVGRAGRAGLSDKGEAFVVCPKPEHIKWDSLDGCCSSGGGAAVRRKDLNAVAAELARRLTSRGDPLSSTIAASGMRRVMLEAVACSLAQSPADIKRYIQCTLLNALNDFQDVVAKSATEALTWLRSHKFLKWDTASSQWQPNPLGRAASAAHLEPFKATGVIADVEKARQCLILASDLHLLFLCVPSWDPEGNRELSSPNGEPRAMGSSKHVPDTCPLNVMVFTRVYRNLSNHERRVAEVVGVSEQYVDTILKRNMSDRTLDHLAKRRVCHRFLRALQLFDVIREKDEDQIVKDFSLGRNDISQLQEEAARYAGQVAAVCGPMGWGDIEVLITRLQDRITAGAQEEILCLTSIPMIGAARARVLYNAGYRTPEDIVRLSVKKLAEILEKCRGSKGGEMRAAGIIHQGAKTLCEEQRRAKREESEAALRELEKLTELGEDDLAEDVQNGVGSDDSECQGPKPMTLDVSAARGTVVVRRDADLEALIIHWRNAPLYAFCLQPALGSLTAVSSPPVGVALAFQTNPHATFYAQIKLTKKTESEEVVGGNDSKPGCFSWLCWEEVRDILAIEGPTKVTVDLKPQLRAMGAAIAAAANPAVNDGPSLSRHAFDDAVGTVAGPVVDVRVAGWLLHPDATGLSVGVATGWSQLSEGSEAAGPAEPLLRSFVEVDAAAVRAAAAWPLSRTKSRRLHAAAAATSAAAAAALAVYSVVSIGLEDIELKRALEEVEMPLVPVLAAMEAYGVGFSPEVLMRQIRQVNRRLEELEVKCAEIVEKEGFKKASLKSSNDVERVLFEDLKLPVPPCAVIVRGDGVKRNLKKRFRTNAEVLQILRHQHPLPAIILEHRTLSKCAAMAEEMVDLAVKQNAGLDPRSRSGAAKMSAHALTVGHGAALATGGVGSDGVVRLRGWIHQTNTETGRLAMEEPNLQTVPKPRAFALTARYSQKMSHGGTAVSPGTDPGAEETLAIRTSFRAPPGKVLIAADYRQLELRLMAHFSGDSNLVSAFNDVGGDACAAADPFRELAAKWKRLAAPTDVSDTDRAMVKSLAYGVVYGSGPARFATEMGVTEADARVALEDFKRSIPGVDTWRQQVVSDARRRVPPHVVTIAGRRRYLPNLRTNAPSVDRAADERKAVNTVCQGSAADVVKRAMIDIHRRLSPSAMEAGAWEPLRRHGACRMVLQIHDELLFEVDEKVAPFAVRAVRAAMEATGRMHNLSVPLPVKVSVGTDWGNLEEVHY